MGVVVAATLSFIVALILWAIGVKFFDAFFLTALVVLFAAMARVIVPVLAKRSN